MSLPSNRKARHQERPDTHDRSEHLQDRYGISRVSSQSALSPQATDCASLLTGSPGNPNEGEYANESLGAKTCSQLTVRGGLLAVLKG